MLSLSVFKKSSEKSYSRLHSWLRALRVLVGPESQTVTQHYFTIGAMYRVIRVVAFRGTKGHPYGRQSKHGTITQFCFSIILVFLYFCFSTLHISF